MISIVFSTATFARCHFVRNKIQPFGSTEHSSVAGRYPIYKAVFAAYAQSADILKNEYPKLDEVRVSSKSS